MVRIRPNSGGFLALHRRLDAGTMVIAHLHWKRDDISIANDCVHTILELAYRVIKHQ
jgi:hypothetical protein